jgi:Arc/MetJ family transcription regulator
MALPAVAENRNHSVMHIDWHHLMLLLMHIEPADSMRTTVNLDDALLAAAHKLTGIEERTALLHEALKALIARESAQRLANLRGTQPELSPIRRRRSAG